jgi:hypothetical protein
MKKLKQFIYLLAVTIILQSCTDVKTGTIFKCKHCKKVITDNTEFVSVAFWKKKEYKVLEDFYSYCNICKNEMVPYTVTYNCRICKLNYEVKTLSIPRYNEPKNIVIDGLCNDICSKVKYFNLASIYDDFNGKENYESAKYTSANNNAMWAENYENQFILGEGKVINVDNHWYGGFDFGSTYIELEISKSHHADIYLMPSEEYKYKILNRGDNIKFIGRLKSLGIRLFKGDKSIGNDIDSCKIISIN